MDAARVPISIVCVFNDPVVRAECLDRSIDRLRADTSIIDYVTVDNTSGAFSTAGAALMDGVSRARFDCIAFVHQDVVLHSIVALEQAAGFLGQSFGVLGAVGVTKDNQYFGRIRDRVVLLGQTAARPVDVDSLDEVLFLVDRATLAEYPLATARELSWHGYAVEYGLRMRRAGRRVGAVSIPLTHNSLTTNLENLTEAHQYIADMYPEAGIVRTTCGVIRPGLTRPKPFSSHRWRYRWMRGSVSAARIRRRTAVSSIVLSDLRLDLDDLLAALPGQVVRVINLDRGGTFHDQPSPPQLLRRGDEHIEMSAMTLGEIRSEIASSCQRGDHRSDPVLITNLEEQDLAPLVESATGSAMTIGLHDDAGCWLLVGASLGPEVDAWSKPAATPFRLRAPRRYGHKSSTV